MKKFNTFIGLITLGTLVAFASFIITAYFSVVSIFM